MLGIICLVVSLFELDVCVVVVISLPFAVPKFVFDVGQNHRRYSRGWPESQSSRQTTTIDLASLWPNPIGHSLLSKK